MIRKELYMIGNSHIDPVWFWNWEEGMQEVKATYASALERMKEFKDFKFTCTSTAFLEWIEGILPEMFEEIQKRVEEGRWELTGGWFIEPDCILPCGEAFVRQGLYGQRYLQSRFGKTAGAGSNVDSFGHNHILPQILKKSGMDSYIFMRPRLDTPVFVWESDDGSQVNAISLPAEYTTWFHEPTVKNIEVTLERTKGYDKMPCCYGVGNHGGGPTIENIQSILALQDAFADTHLKFSTFGEFLEDTKDWELPVIKGPFEHVNEGCYSIDSVFKQKNRLAESRLTEADSLMSMAALMGGDWMKQTGEMERLWKTLLFNQFHDTMGGTAIKSAREEALMQLGSVCAKAGEIRALAIQRMANLLDTRGTGFPLILFNTDSQAFDDWVEVELEWFCQSPLKLYGPDGREIPYQRIHTDAKVRHTTLGGRRRFVFQAQIPPYGFAVYRAAKEEDSLGCNKGMEINNPDCSRLENEFLRAVFDEKTGCLVSLTDKTTDYDALKGAAEIQGYVDERDAWGHRQGKRYEKTEDVFSLISMEKVESGALREVIRVRRCLGPTVLEQLFYLGAQEKEIRVENRLKFNHTWTLLKAAFPVGTACSDTAAETAYGVLKRRIDPDDSREYYMQRFLNVQDEKGAGLAVANDGKYAFNMEDGKLQITLCRSAIYAQGNSPDWYNEKESYQYTDQGEQTFWLVLKPHGRELPHRELYRIARKINGSCSWLFDSAHAGKQYREKGSFFSADAENVSLCLVKKCEDDDAFILRLLEMQGQDTECTLTVGEKRFSVHIGHHEILTLKITKDLSEAIAVNLLEWEA